MTGWSSTPKEARPVLDQATRWSDQHLGVEPFGEWEWTWWSWYTFQILRREAEALIVFDPVFPDDPFAYREARDHGGP
jgi:hypothetical protein